MSRTTFSRVTLGAGLLLAAVWWLLVEAMPRG
jgi:hypothetical protein